MSLCNRPASCLLVISVSQAIFIIRAYLIFSYVNVAFHVYFIVSLIFIGISAIILRDTLALVVSCQGLLSTV